MFKKPPLFVNNYLKIGEVKRMSCGNALCEKIAKLVAYDDNHIPAGENQFTLEFHQEHRPDC